MSIRKLYLLPNAWKNPWANRIAMTFDCDYGTKYEKKGRRPVILYIGEENETLEQFEKRLK
jgi:hypothetical protein